LPCLDIDRTLLGCRWVRYGGCSHQMDNNCGPQYGTRLTFLNSAPEDLCSQNSSRGRPLDSNSTSEGREISGCLHLCNWLYTMSWSPYSKRGLVPRSVSIMEHLQRQRSRYRGSHSLFFSSWCPHKCPLDVIPSIAYYTRDHLSASNAQGFRQSGFGAAFCRHRVSEG